MGSWDGGKEPERPVSQLMVLLGSPNLQARDLNHVLRFQ